MSYNLASPVGIVEPCELFDLASWYARELAQVPVQIECDVLEMVAGSLEVFVRWPDRAMLLWQNCDRVPEAGKRQKYFKYPDFIKSAAARAGLKLDTRPNGPAIASFVLAGGTRPERFGSTNAWSIHHLYSGKFPYFGCDRTLHAAREGDHFTQSAGLIAVHPIADALVDEFPFFAWLLRAHAYQRFGYDPDGVFSPRQSALGFAADRACEVLSPDD